MFFIINEYVPTVHKTLPFSTETTKVEWIISSSELFAVYPPLRSFARLSLTISSRRTEERSFLADEVAKRAVRSFLIPFVEGWFPPGNMRVT